MQHQQLSKVHPMTYLVSVRVNKLQRYGKADQQSHTFVIFQLLITVKSSQVYSSKLWQYAKLIEKCITENTAAFLTCSPGCFWVTLRLGILLDMLGMLARVVSFFERTGIWNLVEPVEPDCSALSAAGWCWDCCCCCCWRCWRCSCWHWCCRYCCSRLLVDARLTVRLFFSKAPDDSFATSAHSKENSYTEPVKEFQFRK